MQQIDLRFVADTTQLKEAVRVSNQLEREIDALARREASGKITTEQYSAAVSRLGSNLQKTTGGTIAARNAVLQYSRDSIAAARATQQMNAAITTQTKGMNRFGVVTQQAGYQFSDFIVQVQSGQSAFVAFSQQATQLVGVLPLLFASAGTGIIALTAGLSIAIPLLSALGNAFFGAGKEAEDAADSIETFDDIVKRNKDNAEELGEKLEFLRSTFEDFEAFQTNQSMKQIEAQLKSLREELEAGVEAAMEVTREQGRQGAANVNEEALKILKEGIITNNEDLRLKQEQIEKLEEQLNLRLAQVAAEKELENAEKSRVARVAMFANLFREAAEKIKEQEEAQAKVSEFVAETTDNLEKQIGLLATQVRYGAESAQAKEVAAKLARDEYEANLRTNGVLGDQLVQMMNLYDTMVQTEQKARETSEAIAFFRSSDLPFTDRVAALAQMLGIAADEAKRLVDNLPVGVTFGDTSALSGLSGDQLLFGGMEGDKPKTRSGGGGKSPGEQLAEEIEKLQQKLEIEEKLLGVFGDRRDIQQTLLEMEQKYGKAFTASQRETVQAVLEATAAVEAQRDALQANIDTVQGLYDSIGGTLADTLMSIRNGTKDTEDAFKDMAKAIITELYNILVVQRIVGSFNASTGQGTGLVGMLGGALGNLSVYDGGGYTGNGARTGGLDGKGGFMAMLHPQETVVDHTKGQTGPGGGVVVQQSFNFSANGDDSVKKIIAESAPAIAEMTQKKIIDSRRRGGTMRSTFG